MPVFYEAPKRQPRGYRTVRDAVDGFKRISAERLASEQAQAQKSVTPEFATGEFTNARPYDSSEWLARNALPRPPEMPQMEFAPPDPVTADQLAAAMRESDPAFGRPFQPPSIPQSYFEPQPSSLLERTGHYAGEAVGALGRAAANTFTLNHADDWAARAATATGIGGIQGDYVGNLRRQQMQSELARIKSPHANLAGQGFAFRQIATPAVKMLLKNNQTPRFEDTLSAPSRTPYIKNQPKRRYNDY
jgi:hypothetical protein